jgi:hypothetical protein
MIPPALSERKAMSSIAKNRRAFAGGLAAIATAITLASAGASYSINLQSFADWPPVAARVFAFLATAGTEATFALLLFGVSAALSGALEKALAVAGLAALVLVMAVNFTTHRLVVTGGALSPWQAGWLSYAGSGVLFGILALVVALSLASHEARERRLARDIEFYRKQRRSNGGAKRWRVPPLASISTPAARPSLKPFAVSYNCRQLRQLHQRRPPDGLPPAPAAALRSRFGGGSGWHCRPSAPPRGGRKLHHPGRFSASDFRHRSAFSATPRPATRSKARPAPLVTEDGLEVFADPESLHAMAAAGMLRVHKHGSGEYRGRYLALRPAGGRGDKRPMLASGKPEKLRAYLAGHGVRLCLTHQRAGLVACPECSTRKRRREARAT